MTKPPMALPLLPPSLVLILSDGHHDPCRVRDPYAIWTPPSRERIVRHQPDMKRALDDLLASQSPAPEELVRKLLAKFAVLKSSRERTRAEWKLVAEEYHRLLGHYPADIWLSAYNEYLLSGKFFPDISELNEVMARRLRLRKQQVSRLEQMLREPSYSPDIGQ